MTTATTKMIPPSTGRANWLGRVLKVQNSFDRQLRSVMNEALAKVGKVLSREPAWRTGSQVSALQLRLAQQELRGEMATLWGNVESLTHQTRQDAAQAAVDGFIYDQSRYLTQAFRGNRARKTQFANSMRQTARRNVEAMETRVLGESYFPLAESVYKNRQLANGRVDQTINVGLALGKSGRDIAKDVENLINPDVPGGISYAAKRLGRSELNNAFHAQSIKEFEDCPWITDVKWNLSKMHKDDPTDVCEELAFIEFFPKTAVPVKPHPNCMCYITPKLMDRKAFEDALVMGHFDMYVGATATDIMGMQIEPPSPVAPEEYSMMPGIDPEYSFGDAKTELDAAEGVPSIAEVLQEFYPNTDLGFNWNEDHVPEEGAREVAHAIDDFLTQFPSMQAYLMSFDFDYINVNGVKPIATTMGYSGGGSDVCFNTHFSEDPLKFFTGMAQSASSGFHVPNSNERHWYTATWHELMHVMDNATGNQVSDNLTEVAERLYADEKDLTMGGILPMPTIKRDENWGNWIRDEAPSWYSMVTRDGNGDMLEHNDIRELQPREFTAEGGTDWWVNGKAAKRFSRSIWNRLTELAEAL